MQISEKRIGQKPFSEHNFHEVNFKTINRRIFDAKIDTYMRRLFEFVLYDNRRLSVKRWTIFHTIISEIIRKSKELLQKYHNTQNANGLYNRLM